MSSEFEHNLDWSLKEDLEHVVHQVDELAVDLHAPTLHHVKLIPALTPSACDTPSNHYPSPLLHVVVHESERFG